MYAEGLFASFGKERGRASWVLVNQCSQLSSLSFVGVSSRYIRNPKQFSLLFFVYIVVAACAA